MDDVLNLLDKLINSNHLEYFLQMSEASSLFLSIKDLATNKKLAISKLLFLVSKASFLVSDSKLPC